MRGIRVTIVAVEKNKDYIFSGCMSVALGIQHARSMRRITLSPLTCPALPYFATLPHKRHDYGEKIKVTDHKMCLSIFSITYV